MSSRFSDNETATQQKQLERYLDSINTAIQERAKADHASHINAHREIQRTAFQGSKKNGTPTRVTSYRYTKLPDGVHPDNRLKTDIFTKVCRACVHVIKKKVNTQRSNPRQP